MTSKHRAVTAAIAVLFIGLTLALRADDRGKTPAPDDHDGWMELKLRSSQQVFESLTHGEFDKIETAARRMLVLNLLEQWMKRKEFTRQSEYKGQLNAFEFSVKELVRHAEDNNTEGALEAYVTMSRSCVRCHELIRDLNGAAAK